MRKQFYTPRYTKYLQSVIDYPLYFHLGLWMFILLILSVLTSLNGAWPFSFYFLNTIALLPSLVCFSVVMDALGQQLIFGTRKFGVYGFLFLLMTLCCALLIPILSHLIMFGLFYPRVFEPSPWFNWHTIPQNLILIWFPFFIVSVKTFFVNWFLSEKEKLTIENKRLLAEIQLMKIKLHPHFLFNTLNNLYAMSTINCERSSEYILKLSDIYRTMLYECDKEFFPLNEEFFLIENYIELERIRYDERLDLQFIKPESVDEYLVLPPLLLFTFVENAFKHGCRNDIGKPFVNIKVSIDDEFIVFEAKNSVPDHSIEKSKYGGIGLDNTQKRLDLIYENEYKFEADLSTDCYSVYLRIPKLFQS